LQPSCNSTFQNGWGNIGGVEQTKFRIAPDGLVHVEGGIDGGAVNNAAFTLRAGFRPAGTRNIVALGGGAVIAYLTIDATGAVTPRVIGAGAIFFNFEFYAEA
jgi:hypothetical protein